MRTKRGPPRAVVNLTGCRGATDKPEQPQRPKPDSKTQRDTQQIVGRTFDQSAASAATAFGAGVAGFLAGQEGGVAYGRVTGERLLGAGG